MMMMNNLIIPDQVRGSKLDVSAQVKFDNDEEALLFFQIVKQRLLNVNNWSEICQLPASSFTLIDETKQKILGLANENDYIRINIPGPGSKLGEGFDWVKIINIDDQLTGTAEQLSITVKPSNHPLKPANTTAHFFVPSASSTFQVKRNGNIIYAEVHGRNEQPNNKKGFLIDRIRNTIVALAAKIGFSFPQWKLLVEGLVKR